MSEPVPRNTPTPLLETIGVNPVEPSPKSNEDWHVVVASWPEMGRELGRMACGSDDEQSDSASPVSIFSGGTLPQQVGWWASRTNCSWVFCLRRFSISRSSFCASASSFCVSCRLTKELIINTFESSPVITNGVVTASHTVTDWNIKLTKYTVYELILHGKFSIFTSQCTLKVATIKRFLIFNLINLNSWTFHFLEHEQEMGGNGVQYGQSNAVARLIT